MSRAARAVVFVLATVGAVAWWTMRAHSPSSPPTRSDPPRIAVAPTVPPPTTAPAPREPAVVALPAPPFDEWREAEVADRPPARTRLTIASSQKRDVLEDDEAWLARHGLVISELADPVARALVPPTIDEQPLETLIRAPAGLLAIYGGRFLRVAEGGETLTLDLQAWLHGPSDRPNYMRDVFSDADYADLIAQKVGWAARVGAVLYFDNHHDTYAKDSGNHTAYVSAFDVERRTLVWRTRPLVAKARNFLVLGDVIVTGYGMTREPDFVHVIDAGTGRILQSLPVPSAPALLATKGDRVWVACYDAEVELRVTR
jgi:hypothetical protein